MRDVNVRSRKREVSGRNKTISKSLEIDKIASAEEMSDICIKLQKYMALNLQGKPH